MAFLDFMQERQASQQQPVAQTSQRQQSQTPSVDKLPSHVKAEAVEAARPAAVLMDKATQHQAEVRHDISNRTDGKEALIRNQGDQGKTQHELSPTDHSKSQTQMQGRMQDRGRGVER
jgi:hypothetical protein